MQTTILISEFTWAEILKNPDVSYLLITIKMSRSMDRPFLRTTLKFLAVWLNSIPKKHSALKTLHTTNYILHVTEYLTLSYLTITFMTPVERITEMCINFKLLYQAE